MNISFCVQYARIKINIIVKDNDIDIILKPFLTLS
ncbi:hypothetical protein VCHA50O407_100043 [Vibrio chagasii]|nr:hypothetical protein VCHA50O407_100043 [Vibrio chagasii]CAH7154197.1 hypothetical protein VCHA38O210_110027 [Vibrio chagasii]CAH7446491.1 hypothetical protein VCHA50P424_90152 [Vibrio chagasii]